ncbi:MAG TPA: hypothetical protein VN911_21240 [Candidatus Acidoferrum sp.]|nr:hypothetical protein [Candidatus Acidoferrum sp.]
MEKGAVLGIDVGFAEHRQTSCLCLLEWSDERVRLTFKKVGTNLQARSLAISNMFCVPTHLAAVAIDGPLTRGLRHVLHYRAAEALLSRGVFQKRGKPGQTSSPTGQKLHQHATQFAKLVLSEAKNGRVSVAHSTHIEPIDEAAIVEAFPNQFLASLIDEDTLPVLHRDASDRYWEQLTAGDSLSKLLAALLPNRRFGCRPKDIYDHDERAATVCALTGLAVATELAVGVGDPEDGDIFLPPATLWGAARSGTRPWVEVALRANIPLLRTGAQIANHLKARVCTHESYWIP